ncbi:retrovirus-related pol polyprotein from transposon TNT 1-94 [Tanacetum coccineum]
MVVLGAKRPWGASVQTRFERASKFSYDSPLRGGNTPRSDEDNMTLQELTDLCTKLSDGVLALETDLRQTQKVYGTSYTKLIMKVKKLKKIVKTSQARRRAKIAVSDDDMASEDSSKQGRMIDEIDQDVGVTLVTPIKVSSQKDQPKDQLGVLSAAKVLADAARVHTYSRRRRAVSTGSGGVSTASRIVSTAGMIQQVNIIIPSSSETKDKGKAIMTKSKLEQITTKLKQRQERAGYEAGFIEDEWEDIRARVKADKELTQKLQAEERDKYSEVDQARMLVYLINQRKRYFTAHKAEHVSTFTSIETKDKERESELAAGSSKRPRAKHDEEHDEESVKKQKLEENGAEKEELGACLDIVLGDEIAMHIESLATKYPIIDWKTHILTENMMYYQIIRADGSSRNYKIFSEMLDDFDKQDMGDLKTLFEPYEEDEVWRNQQGYNLISWRLFDSCGVHVLLIVNGIAIYMMIEKKYPLTQEMLSRMTNRRLEVDHESDQGIFDSGCSRHMTGNKSYLTDYQDINGGFVALAEKSFRTVKIIERMKGIKREFSVARTPQQNRVAKRKNRTLIEAARTMLADSLLPTTFWAEAVNTACYVQNRVLVTKPHNKTPYELLLGRPPSISFMRPFRCPMTILNTLDPLGKFDGKADEGFLVGYSIHIRWSSLEWLFDIDSLTKSMNYEPVIAGNQNIQCTQEHNMIRIVYDQVQNKGDDDVQKKVYASSNTNRDSTANLSVSTVGPSINTASENINTGSPNINIASPIPNDSSMQSLENTGIFDDAYNDREVGA